jgi:hypothetical protein
MTWADQQGVTWRLVRIGVRNLTDRTVRKYRVSVVEQEPQGSAVLPQRLIYKDERPGQALSDLQVLDPSPFHKFIDLALRAVEVDVPIVLQFATPGVANTLHLSEVTLTLLVEGTDVPYHVAHSCKVVLGVDDSGAVRATMHATDMTGAE